MTMTLTPHKQYPDFREIIEQSFAGWTGNDEIDTSGYNVYDYFDGLEYLGPDDYGVEPLFHDDWQES